MDYKELIDKYNNMFFSDTTPNFISPAEPEIGEDIRILLRAKKNLDIKPFLVRAGEKLSMSLAESDDFFDYYETFVKAEGEKVTYYFEIEDGVYYDRRGLVNALDEIYFFSVIPGFSTPDWAKGAVMYQIYVDRFCNGDSSNDVVTGEYFYIDNIVQKIENWDKYPAADGTKEFYGGDLQGVMNKLPYLKSLGVEVIYFNPLFVSPSNHKYDIQDYDYIDPHFGKIVEDGGETLNPGQNENYRATKYIKRVSSLKNLEASNAFFAELVARAHELGIKVIIDGVFNHCGSFNKWMDAERIYEHAEGFESGAFISKESPYNSYFDFFSDSWPYNGHYAGWWDYNTLPKLNYEGSEKLEEYILGIGKKWVSPPYNCDGWRLDVAADLGHSSEYNHSFWQKFRKAVKEANPEALILAEHYGDTSYWLKGNEWDSVMNYDAFMEPVTWFLTGMEKHSDEYIEERQGNAEIFNGDMNRCMANLTYPSLMVAMNELSNHDHSRFMTRTAHTVGRTGTHGAFAADCGISRQIFMAGVIMQMTWPGAPTIYYGDEAGVCGFTDPDNRRTYPWGHEDYELIAFHKDLIALRKRHPELRDGSLKMLDCEKNLLVYSRFYRDKPGESVIIINISEEETERQIDLSSIGVDETSKVNTIFSSSEIGYIVGGETVEQKDGILDITLKAKECRILSIG